MNILLDVDGVLADFPAAALRWINGRAVGPSAFALDQIKEHDLLKAFDLLHLQKDLDQWCIDTNLCRELPVYEGAQEFVQKLRGMGDLLIVTSPYSNVPNWCHARLAWLEEHFGIGKRDVIFCKRKEMVRGHVLIDDKLENCEAFVGKSKFRSAIVFDRPWNRQRYTRGTSAILRAASYEQVLRVLEAA